ncbi:hypothetical protein IT575_14560 [bacterium]|nr:hypothetical protein [bacterium]
MHAIYFEFAGFEYAGRSHSICAESNWQEVAEFALYWALAPTEVLSQVKQEEMRA